MQCPFCGAQLPDSASVCPECGRALPASSAGMGLAIASLILSVFSFGLSFVAGLPGAICGLVALRRANAVQPRSKAYGLAVAGLVINLVGSFISLFFLGMVAAIALPAFFKAREHARQSSCLSNEKQLALGMLMYAADYDERFPLAENWTDGLYPYIKNNQILVCPSAPDNPCGYAFNSALAGLEQSKLKTPAEQVMLFESDAGRNAAGGKNLLVPEPRHSGGDNFAFCDGHCKWYSRKSSASLRWDLPLAEPNLSPSPAAGAPPPSGP